MYGQARGTSKAAVTGQRSSMALSSGDGEWMPSCHALMRGESDESGSNSGDTERRLRRPHVKGSYRRGVVMLKHALSFTELRLWMLSSGCTKQWPCWMAWMGAHGKFISPIAA